MEHVYDGDTLRLRGGDKLRLIGINTPELGRDGRADEPLAAEARAALQSLTAEGLVWLQAGQDARDRYGRRLAHAFDRDGRSLSAELLRRGLGFQVLVAPNFAYADCFAAQEYLARESSSGVWSEERFSARSVQQLREAEGGFVRLRDEITHVSFKDNGWWVQLGGKVGLRIRAESQSLFSRAELRALQGTEVEVRGWLVPMEGNWWLMNLDHPAMMR